MTLTLRSGGQSGVDRAVLDVALELGLKYSGWCPHGGWAEDHPVPPGVRAMELDPSTHRLYLASHDGKASEGHGRSKTAGSLVLLVYDR